MNFIDLPGNFSRSFLVDIAMPLQLQESSRTFFDGVLDDIAIFDYSLTASDVDFLYNGYRPLDAICVVFGCMICIAEYHCGVPKVGTLSSEVWLLGLRETRQLRCSWQRHLQLLCQLWWLSLLGPLEILRCTDTTNCGHLCHPRSANSWRVSRW